MAIQNYWQMCLWRRRTRFFHLSLCALVCMFVIASVEAQQLRNDYSQSQIHRSGNSQDLDFELSLPPSEFMTRTRRQWRTEGRGMTFLTFLLDKVQTFLNRVNQFSNTINLTTTTRRPLTTRPSRTFGTNKPISNADGNSGSGGNLVQPFSVGDLLQQMRNGSRVNLTALLKTDRETLGSRSNSTRRIQRQNSMDNDDELSDLAPLISSFEDENEDDTASPRPSPMVPTPVTTRIILNPATSTTPRPATNMLDSKAQEEQKKVEEAAREPEGNVVINPVDEDDDNLDLAPFPSFNEEGSVGSNFDAEIEIPALKNSQSTTSTPSAAGSALAGASTTTSRPPTLDLSSANGGSNTAEVDLNGDDLAPLFPDIEDEFDEPELPVPGPAPPRPSFDGMRFAPTTASTTTTTRSSTTTTTPRTTTTSTQRSTTTTESRVEESDRLTGLADEYDGGDEDAVGLPPLPDGNVPPVPPPVPSVPARTKPTAVTPAFIPTTSPLPPLLQVMFIGQDNLPVQKPGQGATPSRVPTGLGINRPPVAKQPPVRNQRPALNQAASGFGQYQNYNQQQVFQNPEPLPPSLNGPISLENIGDLIRDHLLQNLYASVRSTTTNLFRNGGPNTPTIIHIGPININTGSNGRLNYGTGVLDRNVKPYINDEEAGDKGPSNGQAQADRMGPLNPTRVASSAVLPSRVSNLATQQSEPDEDQFPNPGGSSTGTGSLRPGDGPPFPISISSLNDDFGLMDFPPSPVQTASRGYNAEDTAPSSLTSSNFLRDEEADREKLITNVDSGPPVPIATDEDEPLIDLRVLRKSSMPNQKLSF